MLMQSTYSLKSRFQQRLLPIRDWLITRHISPNTITLSTCGLCLLYACLLAWKPTRYITLIGLPVFLFIRMALNALDGMVASATQQQTPLGSVLNEVCDIISDVALFSIFIVFLPVKLEYWVALLILIILSEFVALAIFQAINKRPYSGPFGKSDRAVYLAIVGISYLIFPTVSQIYNVFAIIGILLSLTTLLNRFKLLQT